MTRFKEFKRIENAIEHKDQAALRWALGYCTARIQIATRKDHIEHWRKIERKVRAVLETLETDGELKTIFVRLLGEGTDVWRPVEARLIDANTFEIVSDNPSPDDEKREFGRGQNVKCKEVFIGRGRHDSCSGCVGNFEMIGIMHHRFAAAALAHAWSWRLCQIGKIGAVASYGSTLNSSSFSNKANDAALGWMQTRDGCNPAPCNGLFGA